MIFMTTLGGDPDAAYRMARAIQREYGLETRKEGNGDLEKSDRKFFLFVDSFCSSAGTLVALGATHLVLSDYAELGPLDIQIRRPDEPMERDSGLTPSQALTSLERWSKSLFKEHFEQLRSDPTISLTTRTAVENAANITSGLIRSIYAQIDPMRLGEVERLMGIAAEYGERLGKFNLKQGTIPALLTDYPSHGFVIDRREARELFENVEVPKETIRKLGKEFRRFGHRSFKSSPFHFYYTSEANISFDEEQEEKKNNGGGNPKSRRKGKAQEGKENAEKGKRGTPEG